MDLLEQIAQRIIAEQELIIGPLAKEVSLRVLGIKIEENGKKVILTGDKKELVDQLVARYALLFGEASVQVCRDAAAPILSQLTPNEIPGYLK